jgi:hypothetical protein
MKTQILLIVGLLGWCLCTPPPRQTSAGQAISSPATQAAPVVQPAPAVPVDSVISRRADPVTFPVSAWTGKRFMLLEKVKMFRNFGYHLYSSPLLEQCREPINPAIELSNHRLLYRAFEKNTAAVTAVSAQPDGEYLVTFQVDSPAVTAYGKTTQGIIEGLGLFDDLQQARERWKGAIIFSRRRSIDIYDSTASRFTSVKVSMAEPLKVRDVVWGIIPLPPKPLWLLVQRGNGQAGIIPVHYSWTNVLPQKQTPGLPWAADILEQNPREQYSWDETIWEAIEEHRILTGMSRDQVRLSWGEPQQELSDKAAPSHTTWIYERGRLVFVKDSLTGSN